MKKCFLILFSALFFCSLKAFSSECCFHGLHLDDSNVFFGSASVGVLGDRPTYGINLINDGKEAVRVCEVFVTGPNGGEFHVVEDGCTGVFLKPGSKCTVKVTLEAEELGDKEAYLVFKLSNGKVLKARLWGFADLLEDFGGGGFPGP